MGLKRTRFLLARRPVGRPVAEDFALAEEDCPPLAEGQFLIENRYASLDPAIRGWLDDAPSYMPPVALGDAVRATTVGVVAASRAPDFPVGQWVLGLHAIETHSVSEAGGFTSAIDPSLVPSPTNFLSVLGAVGMTAWFGLLEVGQPQAGETLLVSGAAGAVGSLVGQLGKWKGCRVIGIAGGPEKCARIVERYGFDAAIDHRGKDADRLAAEIRAAAPQGLDMVFENVGGACLDAALLNLRHGARVALCGLISEYNAPQPVGARNLWQLIVHSARIQGLLVRDWLPRFPEGMAGMAELIRAGRIVFNEHVDEGIANAFPAFMRLFDGTNDGKLILKIA
ncbi:MAG: NADP-dependent oxidoreductase [Sphingomonadaceae bacterium]